MRDVNRIYKFCNELAAIWATNVPDWRFGQMMMNVFSQMVNNEHRDPFFPEEDEMMKYFRKYLCLQNDKNNKTNGE